MKYLVTAIDSDFPVDEFVNTAPTFYAEREHAIIDALDRIMDKSEPLWGKASEADVEKYRLQLIDTGRVALEKLDWDQCDWTCIIQITPISV